MTSASGRSVGGCISFRLWIASRSLAMASMRTAMTDDTTTTIPGLEDWQHWALVMARANQMIMEARADNLAQGKSLPGFGVSVPHANNDPMAWMTAGADAWSKGLEAWSQMLGQYSSAGEQKDRRFASPEWRDSPIFDTVRDRHLAVDTKMPRD